MSKEQTPIEQEMLIHFNGKRGIYLNKAQIREVSEFLNAKVLEALEREVVKFSKHAFKEAKAAVIWSNDYPLHVAKNYIETEVKQR